MVSSAVGRLSSKLSFSTQQPLDDEWQVGGRYKVVQRTTVWSTPDLEGEKVCEVLPQDNVLLLSINNTLGNGWDVPRGLIMPPATNSASNAGWIALESAGRLDVVHIGPVQRRRLTGSWEMKARYFVQHPTTLREGPTLTSKKIGELSPEAEVLVLELGLSNEGCHNVRLRARVSTDSGIIGWMSPQTKCGDQLLYPVNLLSKEAVKLHQTYSSTRKTLTPGEKIPWRAGGKYRLLEKTHLLEEVVLSSAKRAQLAPGTMLTVIDVHHTECATLGWCPCAFVAVDDGPQKSRTGWVRCCHKAGHDILDRRDHSEYDRVITKLRNTQAISPDSSRSPEPAPTATEATAVAPSVEPIKISDLTFLNPEPQQLPLKTPRAQSQEPLAVEMKERMDPVLPKDTMESENGAKTPKEIPSDPHLFLNKLKSMEMGAQEDKQVVDKTTFQGSICSCSTCTCSRPT